VDLRRAALSIDRERIEAFGCKRRDELGHEIELQAAAGRDAPAFRRHAGDEVRGGMALEEGRPGELGHGRPTASDVGGSSRRLTSTLHHATLMPAMKQG
jgi:hypothetical protein